MSSLSVTHDTGDQFSVAVRGHVLHVDQPVVDGGADTAPTPVELFVASLATCVGHYAHRYLKRHQLTTTGLAVTAHWDLTTSPNRVGEIQIELTIPEGVPAERQAALLAVASHCTVHNSLASPPAVTVVAAAQASAA